MTAGLAASELARQLGDNVAPGPCAAAARPGTLAGLRAPLRGKAWVRGRSPGVFQEQTLGREGSVAPWCHADTRSEIPQHGGRLLPLPARRVEVWLYETRVAVPGGNTLNAAEACGGASGACMCGS